MSHFKMATRIRKCHIAIAAIPLIQKDQKSQNIHSTSMRRKKTKYDKKVKDKAK